MKLAILLLLGTITTSYGYHIFCVFPVPSYSHNQLGKGIVDSLLKAGHTVTWVTPYPEKVKNPPKNLRVLGVQEVQKFVTPNALDAASSKDTSKGLTFVKEFSNNVTTAVLTNSAVVDVLVNTQFDAVVTESFFSDVMAGVAAVQQAPWILLFGTQIMPMLEKQVDEVRSVTTVPLMFNEASIPMGFKERAVNAFLHIVMSFVGSFDRPANVALYEKLFSPIAAARNVQLPPFDDAYYNVSILFANSHESLSPAFSLPPNVIQIAGYHNDEDPPPLPKDLQDLLDSAKNGFIYFSMGSVLRSAGLKPSTRKALLEKFAALPYTVLWKFEEKIDDVLPPNVHMRSWLPQPSVLVHPNIKAFITHGGQLSSLEAVQAGVPLLAIPVFGDQPANAERAVKAGYALRVTFNPEMADEVDQKLRQLLSSPSYTERVKYLSKIFRARPVRPSKLVSHYIELAIETKGAYHLRSVSLKYTWIERWMVDVIAAVLAAVLIISALLVFLLKKLYRKMCGKSCVNLQKKDSKKKKKN